MRQDPSTDRRLEIEADQGNHLRHRPAVIEQRGLVSLDPSKAQQAGVIAEIPQERRLGYRLPGRPADSADRDHRPPRPGDLLGRQFKDRPEQANARIADRKLRGVDADGEAPDARGEVVAREGPLAALVERARRRQRERMGRDHLPARKPAAHATVAIERLRKLHRAPRNGSADRATLPRG